MSEDGSVVFGNSFGQDTITPFRWSVAAGLELLQPLPGDAGAWTLGVSSDGSLVTGFSSEYPLTSDDLGVRTAVLWRAGATATAVADELASAGIDLSASLLTDARPTRSPNLLYGFGMKDETSNPITWRARLP